MGLITDIEINKLVKRVDADGNGNVSFQEFSS